MGFAGKGVGLVVGASTFIGQSTKQWVGMQGGAAYPIFSKQRIGDALASVIGNGATQKVIHGWGGQADFSLNPMGMLNMNAIGGAAVLIADKFVSKAKIPYYSIARPLIKGTGIGLLAGGLLGGLFDPAQVPQPGTYAYATVPRPSSTGIANPIQYGQG